MRIGRLLPFAGALAMFACSGSPVTPSAMPVTASQASDAGAPISTKVVVAISGTWTGTTTSNDGPAGNGSVSLTFTPGSGGTLSADVKWTSARTKAEYSGTVSGTLDALAVNAQSSQACSYKASASLTDATHMSGTYSAVGTGCRVDAGTFAVVKQGS